MKLAWDSADKTDKHDGGYHRKKSSELYHSTRWKHMSRQFRLAHPLCAECLRKGIYKAAECVDHIVPWPLCKDFFDESNLQSLCSECNMMKGIRDRDTILREGRGSKSLGPRSSATTPPSLARAESDFDNLDDPDND